MSTRLLLLILFLTPFISCKDKSTIEGPNRFSDPKLLEIAKLQDERDGAALKKYIGAKKERHRYYASLAFASVKDTNAIPHLSLRMQIDRSADVRKAAAYALGQIGHEKVSKSLIEAIGIEFDDHARATMIEALGKIRTKENIELILSLRSDDTITDAGIMSGVYQYALRANHDSIQQFALEQFDGRSKRAKFYAAHTLARGKFGIAADSLSLERFWSIFSKLQSPDTRNAFALVFGKFDLDSNPVKLYAQTLLLKQITIESDPLVKCNLIRSLSRTGELEAKLFESDMADELIKQVHPQVLATVSQSLLPVNPKLRSRWYDKSVFLEGSKEYYELLYWQMRKNLAEGKPNIDANAKLRHDFYEYDSSYIALWIIKALSADPANFDFLFGIVMAQGKPFIRSNAMAALVDQDRGLISDYPYLRSRIDREVLPLALKSGDVGLISYACYAIKDSVQHIHLLPQLQALSHTMKLPLEMETYIDVQKAIALLSNTNYVKPKPVYAHPVNWDVVKNIRSNTEVLVKTNKGNFTLRCAVDDAPASVWNFLNLVDSGYYNGKSFHRLVPVFVIQGGCDRGDGWGSPTWSQRAEFSNFKTYTEGSVGLASVGPDTEGYQWFITHSSVPHLTGRYTIFADVVSGQYVIPLLDVGDRIQSIERVL